MRENIQGEKVNTTIKFLTETECRGNFLGIALLSPDPTPPPPLPLLSPSLSLFCFVPWGVLMGTNF